MFNTVLTINIEVMKFGRAQVESVDVHYKIALTSKEVDDLKFVKTRRDFEIFSPLCDDQTPRDLGVLNLKYFQAKVAYEPNEYFLIDLFRNDEFMKPQNFYDYFLLENIECPYSQSEGCIFPFFITSKTFTAQNLFQHNGKEVKPLLTLKEHSLHRHELWGDYCYVDQDSRVLCQSVAENKTVL
ncbi:hypothetical protein TNCV_451211 [Trichonephila clavipes]|nr:hypothetical protein TNCV_451211 [Trichonephila clavipes]